MRYIELGKLIVPAKARRAGNADYPVLSMTMRDGLVNQADKFKKRIASADTSPYKVVERNQLVVGFPIDEGVLAFQDLYDEAIVSPAYNIWNLQDSALIDTKYLQAFLRSSIALSFYKSKLRSTTARRRTLPNDIFLSLSVPLPPLSEQKQIVNLLDDADQLRKLRAQADSHTAALIPALFHEMFGEPVNRGNDWPRFELGEVVTFGSGATPSKEHPEFWDGKVPWVSPKDMKPDEITDAEDHVTESAIETTNLQLYRKDTVLVVVRGMILAHTVPVRLCRLPVAINQDMKALVPKQPIEPEFLRWSLQSQHSHLLAQVSTAGHGTKKLDTDRLSAVNIQLPPLPLQKEFRQRVSVGSNYQLQASSDLTNWTNYGAAFTATSINVTNTAYQRIDSWAKLFFRLQVVP